MSITYEQVMAMEPGEELDYAVAEYVFGKTRAYYHCPHLDEGRMLGFCACPDLPRRSTDWRETGKLIDKMVHEWPDFNLGTMMDLAGNPIWSCMHGCDGYGWPEIIGKTGQEVVCKAAIIAEILVKELECL